MSFATAARSAITRAVSAAATKPADMRVNLFIVGEQKCGTSSLHDLLGSSDCILAAQRKELHYFDGDRFTPDDAAYEANFRVSRFGPAPRYLLDSTPDYCWDPPALQRLHRYNHDASIIMLTRDPVARFVSAYRFYRHTVNRRHQALQNSAAGRRMARFMETEPEFTFERFVDVELGAEPVFDAAARCDYAASLARIGALFPESQIFTTTLEMLSSPETSSDTIGLLGEFLGLNLPTAAFPRRNTSKGADIHIDATLEEALRRRFQSG